MSVVSFALAVIFIIEVLGLLIINENATVEQNVSKWISKKKEKGKCAMYKNSSFVKMKLLNRTF